MPRSSFQYDQPFATQEPAGSTGTVTSDVNIYVINAATGAVVVGAAQNQQQRRDPGALAVHHDSDCRQLLHRDPGCFRRQSRPRRVVGFNDTNAALSTSASNSAVPAVRTYPSSFGHKTAADTIGVGATPWWAPLLTWGRTRWPTSRSARVGRGSSSLQRQRHRRWHAHELVEPDGHRPGRRQYVVLQAGHDHRHQQPSVPGRAGDRPTNLSAGPAELLRHVFGHAQRRGRGGLDAPGSSQLTPAEIRAGLDRSARLPMNGTPPGTWNAAVRLRPGQRHQRDQCRRPARGSLDQPVQRRDRHRRRPSAITVTFNKPVNFSTVSAARPDVPDRAHGRDRQRRYADRRRQSHRPHDHPVPDQLHQAGRHARPTAAIRFSIQSPANKPVVSEDGKDLVATGTISFTLADTTAPTSPARVNGRTVPISSARRSTRRRSRCRTSSCSARGARRLAADSTATIRSYINLNNDPGRRSATRSAITQHGAPTYTVTLNYNGLPQTEMPTDNYAIVVLSHERHESGCHRPGRQLARRQFHRRVPLGSANGLAEDFIQNLGLEALAAPMITTFEMTPRRPTTPASRRSEHEHHPARPSSARFTRRSRARWPTCRSISSSTGCTAAPSRWPSVAAAADSRARYDQVVTTDCQRCFHGEAPGLPEGFQHVRPWWSARPTRRRCRVCRRRYDRRLPHRQDRAADHRCLVHGGGASLAAAQRARSPISLRSRRLTHADAQRRRPGESGHTGFVTPSSVLFARSTRRPPRISATTR